MSKTDTNPLPDEGHIDIHAHLLPDIDDGSRSFDETFALIRRLKAAGFTGSVCTPHIWPELFPDNTPDVVAALVRGLQASLDEVGIDYTVWDGGELRLFDGVIDWMKQHGVPTLGPSRCVLCDFWERQWSAHIDQALEWLIAEGYRPILAHPERIPVPGDLTEHLDRMAKLGVRLQGNLRCLTMEEPAFSRERATQYLIDGRYHVMALDVHRIDTLESRLEGIPLVSKIMNQERVVDLIDAAPRRILSHSDPA